LREVAREDHARAALEKKAAQTSSGAAARLNVTALASMRLVMKSVLFLCTGNSARSIMAEAIMNRAGSGWIRAHSAGSQPKGEVHPEALRLLQALDYDTSGYRSKSWDEFASSKDLSFDYIVTVCNNAAGEACPVIPGKPAKEHWDIPDPAAVQGTPAEIQAAFRSAYDMLSERIASFAQKAR
jgi:protein-tyrosine-phosphatase